MECNISVSSLNYLIKNVVPKSLLAYDFIKLNEYTKSFLDKFYLTMENQQTQILGVLIQYEIALCLNT